MEGFSVQIITDTDAGHKDDQKENDSKCMIVAAKCLVDLIGTMQSCRSSDTHRFIHEIENEETEYTESQAAVVKVVSLVPGFCARKNSRDNESEKDRKSKCQCDSGKCQIYLAEFKGFSLCITEQEFTDERSE